MKSLQALFLLYSLSSAAPHTRRQNVDYKGNAINAISAMSSTANSFSTSSDTWANITGWQAANVYNDIIDNDRYAGNTTWKSTFGTDLSAIATTPSLQNGKALSEDAYTDDRMWWCLAMIRAAVTYDPGNQNNADLKTAIASYNTIASQSLILQKDAGTTMPGRSLEIQAGCDVDGAVYWNSMPTSDITAISTSLFAETSAWLYDITKDTTYLENSVRSLGWIQRNMLNKTSGIVVVDSFLPNNCTKRNGGLTYNTGVYLGALSSLYLSTGNTTYQADANLTATSTALGHFTSKSGTPALVVDEDEGKTTSGDWVQWRDVLFRNLVDYYVADTANDGVRSLIKTFWQANYNQIQSKARPNPGQNLYTAEWFGAIKTASDWGTGSVLSVLNGAMVIL